MSKFHKIKPLSLMIAGLVATTFGTYSHAACSLSPLGDKIYRAAQNTPSQNHTVSPNSMLSLQNQAMDAILPPNIFSGFAEAIAQTQYEIDIQTFLFTSDSDAVREGLKGLKALETRLANENRHGNPVIVRFNLDTINVFSRSSITNVYKDIVKLNLDPELITIELATYQHKSFGANHGKSAIIDGRIAVVGGANFTAPNNLDTPTLDSAYMLRGAIASVILEEYDNAWKNSITWHCTTSSWNISKCKDMGKMALSHIPIVANAGANELPADTCQPMILLGRPSREKLQENIDNPQDQAFLAALKNAQSHVRIMSPNMNAPVVVEAVKETIARGVVVEMVLSYGYEDALEGVPGQGGTNAQVVNQLLKWAKETDEALLDYLKIRWYSHNGSEIVVGKRGLESHLKYMSVDGEVVIVGSANMDSQSWYQSREINVAIDDSAVTSAWDLKVFEPAYNRSIPAESAGSVIPEANAGKDLRRLVAGVTATLDGSQSSGHSISYLWEQISGISVNLKNATTVKATFVVPARVDWKPLKFKLTISTASGESDTDTVKAVLKWTKKATATTPLSSP